MSEFQCVLKKKKISKTEKVSSILLTTHWLNEDEQEDQQLFCHLECFKSKCCDENNIFVED